MEAMELLTEKLELLRRSLHEFETLESRVTTLDTLTRMVGIYNRQVSDELAQAQAMIRQWRNFFSLSLDMLCVADTEGHFLDINPAFVKTLGYQREELLTKPYLDFIHPDDIEATLAEIEKLKTGVDTVSFDNRYRCKDGQWIWLNWTTPAPQPGSTLLYAIARDITERKRGDAEILHRAQHDALTGLYNRAALQHELNAAGERFQRNELHRVALLFIDLDGFKPVNDHYGHQVGDWVLAETGRRLHTSSRSTDVVARLGGDEFVVLIQGPDYVSPSALKQRYEQCFDEPFQFAGLPPIPLHASIGYAGLDASMPHAEQLLDQADQRMYQEKHLHHHAGPG